MTEYDSEKPLVFSEAKSELELIDMIRVRYQMWAEDLDTLNGILIGYHLAGKYSDPSKSLDGFREFLIKKYSLGDYPFSWLKILKDQVNQRRYEIPLFFENLDEFRGLDIRLLGEVTLTWEQRDFEFRRLVDLVNIDYPDLPMKAPHKLTAVEIPGVRIHAFYYDKDGHKYYEQCLRKLDRLLKWSKDCFNIPEEQWVLKT